MLSLIAAAADNNVIGKDNQLIWRLPADLQHFKEVTDGHAVIMGRKTFESIGRPLPNRENIIVTRQPDYSPVISEEVLARSKGIKVANSLEAALELAKDDPEPFVIGGAELYRQALPYAQRIYLTRVHENFEGDAIFPELGPEWKEISRREGMVDEKNGHPHTFLVLERSAL